LGVVLELKWRNVDGEVWKKLLRYKGRLGEEGILKRKGPRDDKEGAAQHGGGRALLFANA
jgi:hypothetical protein